MLDKTLNDIVRIAAPCAIVLLAGVAVAQQPGVATSAPSPATNAPISIRNEVTYAASVKTVPANCSWKDRFVERVVKDAGGRAVIARLGDDVSAQRYLTIEVTHLQAAYGGSFSNKPSWILIHGDLRVAGQRVDGFDFRRTYTQTISECAAAREIATMLVADVAGWLRARSATPAAKP